MAKRKTVDEGAVTRAAVSIGTALGKAAAKFDAWLEQRDAVAQELTAVIGKAQGLLASMRAPAQKAKKAKKARTATTKAKAKKSSKKRR